MATTPRQQRLVSLSSVLPLPSLLCLSLPLSRTTREREGVEVNDGSIDLPFVSVSLCNIISWRALCLTSKPFARNLAHVGTRAGMQLPDVSTRTKVTGAVCISKAGGNVRIPDT